MTRALVSLSGVLWVVIPILCAVGWVSFFRRQGRGEPSVPYESRDPVPWGLLDFALIFLAAVVIQAALVPMLSKSHSAIVVGIVAGSTMGGVPGAELGFDEFGLFRIGVLSFSTLATWAVSLVLVHWRCGATARDLGLPLVSRDIRLGCIAFAMLSVPVFSIQFLLSKFVSESKHPLIESLLANPRSLFFAIAGFAAVIVAPVVEEFLFRVYLQGWLENLAMLRQSRLSGGIHSADFPRRVFWGTVAPRQEAMSSFPSEPATKIGDDLWEDIPVVSSLEMRPAWWPIVVTSLLFSAAHFGHGPDPIPLFFLALGLGYLYQRTHRVWPSVTVHCLVNLTSLYLLWVYVQTQQA